MFKSFLNSILAPGSRSANSTVSESHPLPRAQLQLQDPSPHPKASVGYTAYPTLSTIPQPHRTRKTPPSPKQARPGTSTNTQPTHSPTKQSHKLHSNKKTTSYPVLAYSRRNRKSPNPTNHQAHNAISHKEVELSSKYMHAWAPSQSPEASAAPC